MLCWFSYTKVKCQKRITEPKVYNRLEIFNVTKADDFQRLNLNLSQYIDSKLSIFGAKSCRHFGFRVNFFSFSDKFFLKLLKISSLVNTFLTLSTFSRNSYGRYP
jgi:hypothetical protein